MTNDISVTEIQDEPTLFDKAMVLLLVTLTVMFVLVVTYYIGAYNTVKNMEVSFRNHGEVLLEFNGFVYPPIFDSL